MDLSHGGHLSHGSPKSFSGHLFSAFSYGVDREKERIDFQHLRQLARKCRPKVIIAGASAYPRTLDFAAFREMAEEAGAFLLADIAHIAGLVAAGIHPSPVPFAHAPLVASGIRLGTPILTDRGMKEGEMREMAHRINRALLDSRGEHSREKIAAQASEICSQFPIYADRLKN